MVGSKPTCTECGLRAWSLIMFMVLTDGTNVYVCRQCAKRLDYAHFLQGL